MGSFSEKIPSVLWIPIIVGCIGLFIGAIFVLFYGVGYVEGFSSLILLVLGWIGFRIGNKTDDLGSNGLGIAIGITFFALMGMSLDQTGNFIYNKPLEWISCPANSELVRETIRRSVKGGGVSLSQKFGCFADGGILVRDIAAYQAFGFRFIQYVLLGYILLGLSKSYSRLKMFLWNEK